MTSEKRERPVILAPLDINKALSGLFAIKPPADKPKRKKAPAVPAPETLA